MQFLEGSRLLSRFPVATHDPARCRHVLGCTLERLSSRYCVAAPFSVFSLNSLNSL
jgi:hypothetical protein